MKKFLGVILYLFSVGLGIYLIFQALNTNTDIERVKVYCAAGASIISALCGAGLLGLAINYKKAKEEGFEQGRKEGYDKGKEDSDKYYNGLKSQCKSLSSKLLANRVSTKMIQPFYDNILKDYNSIILNLENKDLMKVIKQQQSYQAIENLKSENLN